MMKHKWKRAPELDETDYNEHLGYKCAQCGARVLVYTMKTPDEVFKDDCDIEIIRKIQNS